MRLVVVVDFLLNFGRIGGCNVAACLIILYVYGGWVSFSFFTPSHHRLAYGVGFRVFVLYPGQWLLVLLVMSFLGWDNILYYSLCLSLGGRYVGMTLRLCMYVCIQYIPGDFSSHYLISSGNSLSKLSSSKYLPFYGNPPAHAVFTLFLFGG